MFCSIFVFEEFLRWPITIFSYNHKLTPTSEILIFELHTRQHVVFLEFYVTKSITIAAFSQLIKFLPPATFRGIIEYFIPYQFVPGIQIGSRCQGLGFWAKGRPVWYELSLIFWSQWRKICYHTFALYYTLVILFLRLPRTTLIMIYRTRTNCKADPQDLWKLPTFLKPDFLMPLFVNSIPMATSLIILWMSSAN